MRLFRPTLWFALTLTGAILTGCASETPESLLDGAGGDDAANKEASAPRTPGAQPGAGGLGGSLDGTATPLTPRIPFVGIGNANGNTNSNENGNVNGNENQNENENGNENQNANTNGNENQNENTNGNENGNENQNANDNANGNGNDNTNGGGGGLCGDGSTRVETELSGPGEGDSRFRTNHSTCREFRARVDNAAPFATYSVAIEGVVVGTIRTDEDGRGELRYENAGFPAQFPDVVLPGDVITIGPLMGVFLDDCSSGSGCS